jgi:hypothetical protein
MIVAGCERDQMGEPFEGHDVTVADQLLHRFG